MPIDWRVYEIQRGYNSGYDGPAKETDRMGSVAWHNYYLFCHTYEYIGLTRLKVKPGMNGNPKKERRGTPQLLAIKHGEKHDHQLIMFSLRKLRLCIW